LQGTHPLRLAHSPGDIATATAVGTAGAGAVAAGFWRRPASRQAREHVHSGLDVVIAALEGVPRRRFVEAHGSERLEALTARFDSAGLRKQNIPCAVHSPAFTRACQPPNVMLNLYPTVA
jgi:hypothetical protein